MKENLEFKKFWRLNTSQGIGKCPQIIKSIVLLVYLEKINTLKANNIGKSKDKVLERITEVVHNPKDLIKYRQKETLKN